MIGEVGNQELLGRQQGRTVNIFKNSMAFRTNAEHLSDMEIAFIMIT